MHHNLEILSCDSLKYKMGNSILILLSYLEKITRMKSDKANMASSQVVGIFKINKAAETLFEHIAVC